MKTLVTGGSGFLGSHLVEQLLELGHEVTIFDLNPPPCPLAGARIIPGDIRDASAVQGAVSGQDVVYHFSGIAGIDDCRQNPRLAMEINVGGTLNVLEACVAQKKMPRFMFSSSAYVLSNYGNIYKTTKIACENLIGDFNKIYGLSYTNLRFGSLYGRRADNRNSIHRMLKEAYFNNLIKYHGTGKETREFIHVRDAARLSVTVLDEEYINRNIIITGNEKFNYDEIFDMIQEIIGRKIDVIKYPVTDDCHYKLTPYNLKHDIGMKLTNSEFIDFGQGIIDCLNEIINNSHD